jgi:hypothetical protein
MRSWTECPLNSLQALKVSFVAQNLSEIRVPAIARFIYLCIYLFLPFFLRDGGLTGYDGIH